MTERKGMWESKPYEEFVAGTPDFIVCRLQFAERNGYKTERITDGTIRIYEDPQDFEQRQLENAKQ